MKKEIIINAAANETRIAITEDGRLAELFTYPGDDHNLSSGFGAAMRRSVDFMDLHVANRRAR